MRQLTIVSMLLLCFLWLANCTGTKSATAAAPTDPLSAGRAKAIERVRASIAGKENMRADSVFQNIQSLTDVSADKLLNIMDRWGSALGVGCDHCHAAAGDWASDVKTEKNVARQMMVFTRSTNENLRKINGLKSERPGLGCNTCHRGEARPGRMGKK
ncbi:MAG: c-type cytochrome [Lewinellaceae bacterium]|nr:c-type cytochrome [Lewinellaceae bacterium]